MDSDMYLPFEQVVGLGGACCMWLSGLLCQLVLRRLCVRPRLLARRQDGYQESVQRLRCWEMRARASGRIKTACSIPSNHLRPAVTSSLCATMWVLGLAGEGYRGKDGINKQNNTSSLGRLTVCPPCSLHLHPAIRFPSQLPSRKVLYM